LVEKLGSRCLVAWVDSCIFNVLSFRPWCIDAALLRRNHIVLHVPLPGRDEIKEVLIKKLSNQHTLTLKELDKVAAQCDSRSTNDLTCLIQNVIYNTFYEAEASNHFKIIVTGEQDSTVKMFVPCEQSDVHAIKMKFCEVPKNRLYFKKITYDAITKQLQVLPVTISVKLSRRMRVYNLTQKRK
jgi:SpoVK/Ycf46/Vps4 family AAA+-type ATPase